MKVIVPYDFTKVVPAAMSSLVKDNKTVESMKVVATRFMRAVQ